MIIGSVVLGLSCEGGSGNILSPDFMVLLAMFCLICIVVCVQNETIESLSLCACE